MRRSPSRVAEAFVRLGEVVLLGVRALAAAPRRPLEGRALVEQVRTHGNRALWLALMMSAFAGLVLAFQFGQGLVRFGARQFIGQLTVLALFREMIPVFSGLALGSRAAAGMAAELGSMKVTEQVDAVRALGADPVKKLVLPRVLAATIVLPVFTALGDLVALLAGMLVAWAEFGVNPRWYVFAVRDFLLVGDFTSGLAKAAFFGLAVGLIGCDAGLRAEPSTEGVGRATTAAVVASSLTVIVLDYLLTRMFFPSVAAR